MPDTKRGINDIRIGSHIRDQRDLKFRPLSRMAARAFAQIRRWTIARLPKLYFGRHLSTVPDRSLVVCPCRENRLCCGLAGLVAFKPAGAQEPPLRVDALAAEVKAIAQYGYDACIEQRRPLSEHYLNGPGAVEGILQRVGHLRQNEPFYEIYAQQTVRHQVDALAARLDRIIAREESLLTANMGLLESEAVDIMSRRIELLKDSAWCLSKEIIANIAKIDDLHPLSENRPSPATLAVFREINAVLNSIDRLEVRGRDSAGISLLFVLSEASYDRFQEALSAERSGGGSLAQQLDERLKWDILGNRSISVHRSQGTDGAPTAAIAFTFKIAAEIGRLGDNVAYLRDQIKSDRIFQILTGCGHLYHTVSSHTRWASVGAITEPNCHPVDNNGSENRSDALGIIHVCLNGDIDNYLELKRALEQSGAAIHADITSDTKIIPLQIANYIREGAAVQEAFRLAVNDFEGSHAISMHTDLAPGKIFLAQKGSGQAIFVGLAPGHYMPTSEVYGFVEETPYYLKLDGEMVAEGVAGKTQGQIFALDQSSAGGLTGITACFYDGTPIALTPDDIKTTEITSRDIDRQDFPHYFLKEISEAPLSVVRTLQNRWKIIDESRGHYAVVLDEAVVPQHLRQALAEDRIKRIFFVGQGTAGVAALACANILNYYLNDTALQINALKASEMSGSYLAVRDADGSMSDALVVAISQSGTTTDTNRTVDMVRERGGHTLAIVNRRDSDITFKVDGVLYTSSGRDIEMSVASTKAFYSQIVAGALLGLFFARLKTRRTDAFVSEEIKQLLALPAHMRDVLKLGGSIERSARRLAGTKTYWAAVGSGPNKASADEIRIKLSELCYKTISSDFVEDKKHIDLSSEPLIIVCAAGAGDTVMGDILKDTAIFKAHKATPIVIANAGENRFDRYADDVFRVPVVREHLAPILNTLVGHLWGYHAALAINEGSRFLHDFRETIRRSLDGYSAQGLDVYEVMLEKSFREKIALFYNEFRARKTDNAFPNAIAQASDIALLLKYLAGRLPVSDFEIDFGVKGTAINMLHTFFSFIGDSINRMSRPVDAIKHQAKTVTVGTSRIAEKLEGILFDALTAYDCRPSQLTTSNVLVLKNLQHIIAAIEGAILYQISGLNLLGEPTEETKIEVLRKDGVLQPIPSRVEADSHLQGTKRIIVQRGNVYIGKGRKDDRSIVIIPLISHSSKTPNMIEYLLLLNVSFLESVPLAKRINALGGKYEHIKNIVQENSVPWHDRYIEQVDMEELFGRSAEKIGESLVNRLT